MIHSLQACRGIAALLVVLYHANYGIFDYGHYFGPKPFGDSLAFAYAACDFLLVLSGFVIMHVHAQDMGQPRELGSYLWKRLSRIYPAYWAVLGLLVPVLFLMPNAANRSERDLDVILTSLFLYPHPQNYLVLGVAWSLVYEIVFYLLFGLFIAHQRLGFAVYVSWTICILAYPCIATSDPPFLLNSWHLRFVAGMGAALVLRHWELPRPRLVLGVGLAVFAGAACFEVAAGPLSLWTRVACFTLSSAMMLAGMTQAEMQDLLPTPPRWLVYLGTASYSIYLVHYPVLGVIAKVCRALHVNEYVPHLALFAAHVIGAVAAGCVFFHLIENTVHVWSKRFFKRARPSIAVPDVVPEEVRRAA